MIWGPLRANGWSVPQRSWRYWSRSWLRVSGGWPSTPAYDIYRHAAEAVDLAAGYRVLASPGAHAATFALASAVLGGATDAFDTVNATTMTGTRNKLEYLDADQSTEVNEDDARWAAQLAERAVADASSFLA